MTDDYIWEDGGEISHDPLDDLQKLAGQFEDEIGKASGKIRLAFNKHSVLLLQNYLNDCDVIFSTKGVRLLTALGEVEATRPLEKALDDSLTTETEDEAVKFAEWLKDQVDEALERVRENMKGEW
jgi:hypothetical protein